MIRRLLTTLSISREIRECVWNAAKGERREGEGQRNQWDGLVGKMGQRSSRACIGHRMCLTKGIGKDSSRCKVSRRLGLSWTTRPNEGNTYSMMAYLVFYHGGGIRISVGVGDTSSLYLVLLTVL